MAIFRDVTITWRGKDYTVTPSMRLMRSIEMGDISLSDIAVRTSQGRPPISHLAFVISKMLLSVGAEISEEEVYSEILRGDQSQVQNMIGVVLMAFSPAEDERGNQDAQSGNQSKGRAKSKAAS
jgi:hypothetical protein